MTITSDESCASSMPSCVEMQVDQPKDRPKNWVPWCVGVIASPRYVSLLDKTIESLWLAGWRSIFIFAEPDTDRSATIRFANAVNADPAEVSRRGQLVIHWVAWTSHCGPFLSTLNALKFVTSKLTWANPIMIIQDDAIVCRKLREILEGDLERAMIADDRFGVMHLFQSMANDTAIDGWIRISPDEIVRRSFGAQGYVFSRQSAISLLGHYWVDRKRFYDKVDTRVALWCREHALNFWQHGPSLTIHLGATVGTLGSAEHWPARIHRRFMDEIDCCRRDHMQGPPGATEDQPAADSQPAMHHPV